MSDSLAVSMPQPAPSVARSWIKANVLAALISTALGLAVLLLSHALGANKPDAGSFAKMIVVLSYLFASAAGLGAFATLNGRALRQKLPAFPLGTWIALHVGVGVLGGLFAGFGALQPPPDASELTRVLAVPQLWIGFIIGGAIGGVLVGLIAGSFQALIMRHAAHGVGAWIGFWVIAAVLSVAVYGIVFITVKPMAGMSNEIIMQALAFAAPIVAAVAMLPAVARLTPRTHTV